MSEKFTSGARELPRSYYGSPRLISNEAARDWWTVLHPPYTMLHLSLVTIGACLQGPVSFWRLVASVAAFFLAVGIGAHSLDELHGRPLHTTLPTWQLTFAAVASLTGALVLGAVGIRVLGGWFAIFIFVGITIAVGYNLELFQGRLHTRTVVVLGWGAFPILTAFYAQHRSLSLAAVLASGFGALITLAQQQLSTPARDLRRRVTSVEGVLRRTDGSATQLNAAYILNPLEDALKTICRAGPLLALALVLTRFAHL